MQLSRCGSGFVYRNWMIYLLTKPKFEDYRALSKVELLIVDATAGDAELAECFGKPFRHLNGAA